MESKLPRRPNSEDKLKPKIKQSKHNNNNFLKEEMTQRQSNQMIEEDVRWKNDFYNSKKDPNGEKTYPPFQSLNNDNDTNFDWSYFTPSNKANNRDLGNREMKYNYNLLNESNFRKYWTTGKHSGYEVYDGKDFDGDGVNDYVAINPQGRKVMGFNERYITDELKGETPYRRDYYSQNKNFRDGKTYMQYLEFDAENKPGWKDLQKLKANRLSAPWKVIMFYLSDVLTDKAVSMKQAEQIAKKLLKCISHAFFATNVPTYQRKHIVKTSEFKNILKKYVTSDTIETFIPIGAIDNVVSALLQGMEGYGNSRILNKLVQWLTENNTKYRISAEEAAELYNTIISKKAIMEAYKQTGINPMNLANNPHLATQFANTVAQKKAELARKHANQDYNIV